MINVTNMYSELLNSTSSINEKMNAFFKIHQKILLHRQDPNDQEYKLSVYTKTDEAIEEFYLRSILSPLILPWNSIEDWKDLAEDFIVLCKKIYDQELTDYKQVEGYEDFMNKVIDRRRNVFEKDPRFISPEWGQGW